MKQSTKYWPAVDSRKQTFLFCPVYIPQGEQILSHQEPNWELSYIAQGKGSRTIGDKKASFSAGEVLLIPPNIPHSWQYDAQISDPEETILNITICFHTDALVNLATAFPGLEDSFLSIKKHQHAVSFVGSTRQSLQEAMQSMMHKTLFEQSLIFLNILKIIEDNDGVQNVGNMVGATDAFQKMKTVELYVFNHFRNKISLTDMANMVDMDKSAFCVFFKKQKGETFLSYLNQHRIKVACQMLSETNKPIAEVCYESGFRDIPHFNRLFKKHFQMSPKAYRMGKQ